MMKYLLSFVFICQIPVISQNQEECLSEYRFNGKKFTLTEREWKDFLPPEQFQVLRKNGTEPAFKNAYYDNKAEGVYVCAGCDLPCCRRTAG